MDYSFLKESSSEEDEDKGAYNPDNNNNPQQGGGKDAEKDPFVASPAEYRHRLVPMTPWEIHDNQEGVTFEGSGMWAISNSADLLITVDGVNYVLRTPKLHEQPLPQVTHGNMLISGLTVVYRTEDKEGNEYIEQTTMRMPGTLEPVKMEGVTGTAHTEFQYFLGLMGPAVVAAYLHATVAVIFEVHQTNTPCTTCQRLIMYNVSLFCENWGKPAAFRGTAEQVYEAAPGDLGTALLAVRAGTVALDRQGPAHIANLYGIHALVGASASVPAKSSKLSGSTR